ncbi:TetR/AcrR family transcriptional regulator [Bacillus subtilis]|nr:TetR/AcrR family transcriptional regulator [Bacillus subtilis]
MAKVNHAASRQRLIDSAVRLIRRQGYAGTGVNEIAREGNAPMGSFYYHFPGGKEELAATAMRTGAEAYGRLIARALGQDGDLPTRVSRIALATAESLASNDFVLGCPVATTALETVTTSPPLRQESQQAFENWAALIHAAALAEGIEHDKAEELAMNVLSLVEGAELIARVQASAEPLHAAARAIATLCRDLME